jgi:hypothetical protein
MKPIKAEDLLKGMVRAPQITSGPPQDHGGNAELLEALKAARESANPERAEQEQYLKELRPIHLEAARIRLAMLRAKVAERQIRVEERAERAKAIEAAEGQAEQRRMDAITARVWDRVALWLTGAILVFIFFLPVISPGCFAQLTHH